MSAIIEGEEVNNVEGDIDIHQLALGIAPLCSGDPEKVFRGRFFAVKAPEQQIVGCASLFTDDESMDRQQFKLAVTAWLRYNVASVWIACRLFAPHFIPSR